MADFKLNRAKQSKPIFASLLLGQFFRLAECSSENPCWFIKTAKNCISLRNGSPIKVDINRPVFPLLEGETLNISN